MSASGIWETLAERLDPGSFRPKLLEDIEVKEFPQRWGNDYAIIANPRDLTHYQLDVGELEILRRMDGSRTVKELVIERFEGSGDLELSRVTDLVRTLERGNFLERRFIDVYGLIGERLQPTSTFRRKLRQFATTLSVDWQGADRLVRWLYHHGLKWLFRRWALLPGAAFALFGIVAFFILVRSGRFELTGESLALGVVVLLVLDYLMVFVHEIGHASVLVHHGRRVRGAGFQIYFGSPAFFVDSSDGLMLDKKHQIVESLAGPYAQMLMGAVASTIALLAPDWILSETLYRFAVINYLVLFLNLIPLLELDGYYVLADLIQVPDLRPRSLSFLRFDLWHKIRARERFSAQDVGLGVYGIAGIAFTIFSFYTAYFYWETVFGSLVSKLWAGGTVARVLLVILALFLLAPVARGGARLARTLASRLAAVVRRIRFRLERSWRIEAAELIDDLPLFDDLPGDVLSDLAGRVRLRTVDAGRPVVRQGDRADAFYVVRRGTLVALEEDRRTGAERTLRTFGRGEAFGELGLVEAAPRRATVRAAEASEVFELDKGTFDRLLVGSVHLPRFEPTLQKLEELRALPSFAHLEHDELAELLQEGAWVDLPAGSDLMVQGAEGDAFYAIGAGQVEVIRDGARVATLGPGAAVGETALLLGVPRTATVRSLTPVRAFRVEREGFDRLIAR
ncbi:MAG TPA: cyclic nucleotide-binding domain-containing protein, partial [Actinomycetota bacterium]|nr:cyclic nucleotide-binding domain-containing protein [Actinomycetota bacterium]